ncbi:MAG: peptidoglycan editing factor PgeF [Paludibacter sp.]|nr:peptidoglycan editing factor PgeF [Paludibacter sp.]
MITYKSLYKYNEIAHFCTSREGGVSVGNYASFNLSPFSGDNPEHFNENQMILCDKLGIDPDKLIIPYQTHGTEIREIGEAFFLLSINEKTEYLNGVDALITQLPQICIGVTTADCVPLLFFDPTKQVIAVAHAGWRGTCARISEKTIHTLIEKFNCNPIDIRVVIGPSISAEVYEIGNDVVQNFENEKFDLSEIIISKNQKIYLDLWNANQQSLINAGVLKDHIEISGICTFSEHKNFFSARRLGIKSGRMLSGIMLKGD